MSAPKYIQKIDVFVSSPGDVAPEREIVTRVIERLNRLSAIRERALLRLVAYEKDAPPVVDGSSAQAVVDRYMMKAEHSDLVICILWARMGTPVRHPETGEQFQSGTEYEFTTAYRANVETGKPYILLYRKTVPKPDADPEQQARVAAFFRRFEGEEAEFRGLYKTYQTLETFEEMVFEHIERIVTRSLIANPAMIEASARPQVQEETRRLDAAMPGQTRVGRPTELWAQVCLPSSDGFRSQLPAYTRSRREQITGRDVRAGGLAVAFPIDPQTGEPGPVLVTVEVRSNDFSIAEPTREVLLWARTDSGLLVFDMTPTRARDRSIVHVTVRQTMPDGPVITLGSASLSTQIAGAGVAQAAAQAAWTLLSLPLTAVELIAPTRSMALEPDGRPPAPIRGLPEARDIVPPPAPQPAGAEYARREPTGAVGEPQPFARKAAGSKLWLRLALFVVVGLVLFAALSALAGSDQPPSMQVAMAVAAAAVSVALFLLIRPRR